jgi:hypothetical protein
MPFNVTHGGFSKVFVVSLLLIELDGIFFHYRLPQSVHHTS